MRRFTVMGFTEAELGFVIAALFAAIAVASLNDRDAQASGARQLQDVVIDRDAAKTELEHHRKTTAAEIARLQSALESSQAELERLRSDGSAGDKRSTKVPQCWEKGESRQTLAELVVRGENLYDLDGEELTIDGVRERLASSIARGESLGCRYVVRARPVAGVDATEHSTAVWRLRRHFDVDDRSR
jgi:multidrug efflux pump subunit AcrA (membrane-fusion protein)